MSNLIVNDANILEIPKKRFMVAVILNAELGGRRVHIIPNVPDTDLDRLALDLRTRGLQVSKDDHTELIILPSGILAIALTELPETETSPATV